MMTEYSQSAFFAKYAHCADRKVLEKIWQAKFWKAISLDLRGEKSLKDISPLTNLTALQKLYISNTQVSDLSPLTHLTALQLLKVSNTQVNDLSPLKGIIEKGIKVIWKDWDGYNGIYIKDTPLCNPSIEIAKQGNEAILRYWKEQEKAAFLQQYAFAADEKVLARIWQAKQSQASELFLRGENISDLSPLKDLTTLQVLDIRGNRVSDLSPLKDLFQLRQLFIHNTEVADLSPLKNFEFLETLTIDRTRVIDIKPLTFLLNIKLINLGFNQIQDLSPLKGLIEKGIEVKWRDTEYIDGIYIKDTPLSNPPIEIAKQGNAAILRYWEEQERSGTIQLNEARLLIVGQGGSGKTTLRKKLMNRQAVLPEAKDTTRGIEIEVLSFSRSGSRSGNFQSSPNVGDVALASNDGSNFGLHIWDFGGQNIQHYAHQFFLSDSAVYALVHSEREQNEHTGYWLNIIQLLGKDSPILIVQNEKFGHSEDLKNLATIRESFPNVQKPIKLDLSRAKETDYKPFKDLESTIQHLACCLPHIGKTYLRSFNDVREQLKVLAHDKHSIPWDDFEDLCGQQGITDTELMRDYARYFHQLGISLWFEEDEFLDQYVFLRPKWIIDALFELLYEGEALRKQAIISVKDVRDIWKGKEYKGMHGNLLRLMKNFEMCYEIVGDTPQYIVPQLLPADRAEYKAAADATKVVFQYKFLPKGFLTRLTCRLHNRIDGDKVWNDAVQFKDAGGATVFAKETYAQNAIELIAEGYGKRQLLNEVINTLKDINTSSKFANLQVEILVPCPCKTCQKGEKRYAFDFDYLRRKLLKGQTKAECQVSLDDVKIKDILREVSPFSFTQIREYIINGRVNEALNLLRGRYDESDEVILLTSQLSQLNLDSIRGFHSTETEKVAYQKLSDRILRLLAVLADEV